MAECAVGGTAGGIRDGAARGSEVAEEAVMAARKTRTTRKGGESVKRQRNYGRWW